MIPISYNATMRIEFPYDVFDEREHEAAVLRRGLEAAAKAFVEAVGEPSGYPDTYAEVRVLAHDATGFHTGAQSAQRIPLRGPVAVELQVSGHIKYPPTPAPTPNPTT